MKSEHNMQLTTLTVITLSDFLCIDGWFAYCYHLGNVVGFSLSQSGITYLAVSNVFQTEKNLVDENIVLPWDVTSPHLTSPHLTSPHLTSPHLTYPILT